MQGYRANGIQELRDGPSGGYTPVTAEDGTVVWWIKDPNGAMGRIGKHEVVEHEDGTITVSPSILSTGELAWHGYLEKGVWREV